MYELFGRYGAIRQIRLGNGQKTRGTAYVVYEDTLDVSPAAQSLLLISGVSSLRCVSVH